ncbi:MAG: integrase, partial [Bacteroidetes bacterium]|nr:integrase [Bacteroidota bacterium]
KFLKRRGFKRIEDIGQHDLQACYQWVRRKFPREEGGVRVLERFLVEKALLHPLPVSETSPQDVLLNRYMAHLRDDHGYVNSTVQRQGCIVDEFLDGITFEEQPNRLAQVCMADIEGFIQRLGKRMGRVALQKPISVIRHFLRFLAASGAVPQGLDSQIDTPRVYRQEQLPRALPWTIVEAFLHSIDRNTSMGKRDYAMFSLMATYGLRACDVVALKLDDIKWRSGCIRICQTKTGNPLDLPFTNQVSSALYDYLKKIPRYGEYRPSPQSSWWCPEADRSDRSISGVVQKERTRYSLPGYLLLAPFICAPSFPSWPASKDHRGSPETPITRKYSRLYSTGHRGLTGSPTPCTSFY